MGRSDSVMHSEGCFLCNEASHGIIILPYESGHKGD